MIFLFSMNSINLSYTPFWLHKESLIVVKRQVQHYGNHFSSLISFNVANKYTTFFNSFCLRRELADFFWSAISRDQLFLILDLLMMPLIIAENMSKIFWGNQIPKLHFIASGRASTSTTLVINHIISSLKSGKRCIPRLCKLERNTFFTE